MQKVDRTAVRMHLKSDAAPSMPLLLLLIIAPSSPVHLPAAASVRNALATGGGDSRVDTGRLSDHHDHRLWGGGVVRNRSGRGCILPAAVCCCCCCCCVLLLLLCAAALRHLHRTAHTSLLVCAVRLDTAPLSC